MLVIAFCISSGFFLVNLEDSEQADFWFIALQGVNLLSCLLGTALVLYHGLRLYNRTLRLLTFIGKGIRSIKNFRSQVYMLMFCMVIKISKQGFVIYEGITGQFLFYDLTQSPDGATNTFIAYQMAYMFVNFIVGELGVFIVMISILQAAAYKSKKSYDKPLSPEKQSKADIIEGSFLSLEE